jgi:hypothetical protein
MCIAFLVLILFLIAQGRLLPGVVIVGSFILFVVWLTGLIEIAIQLFGPINTNCNEYVLNQNPGGASIAVLAFLEQRNICESPCPK